MATETRKQTRRGGPPLKGGRRTTVRLTAELTAEIAEVARELGSTENEALLHLLGVGIEQDRRRREVQKLIDRRESLVAEMFASEEGVEFPSVDELEEAARTARGE